MGAGVRRQTTRDILCARMLIKGYAQSLGFDVKKGDAKVIIYYGNRALPPSIGLTGSELDEHFGVPVTTAVRESNAYFQSQLDDILPGMLADCLNDSLPQT